MKATSKSGLCRASSESSLSHNHSYSIFFGVTASLRGNTVQYHYSTSCQATQSNGYLRIQSGIRVTCLSPVYSVPHSPWISASTYRGLRLAFSAPHYHVYKGSQVALLRGKEYRVGATRKDLEPKHQISDSLNTSA